MQLEIEPERMADQVLNYKPPPQAKKRMAAKKKAKSKKS
jgi:hypothetical protein